MNLAVILRQYGTAIFPNHQTGIALLKNLRVIAVIFIALFRFGFFRLFSGKPMKYILLSIVFFIQSIHSNK